jgi:hypothetical protein
VCVCVCCVCVCACVCVCVRVYVSMCNTYIHMYIRIINVMFLSRLHCDFFKKTGDVITQKKKYFLRSLQGGPMVLLSCDVKKNRTQNYDVFASWGRNGWIS